MGADGGSLSIVLAPIWVAVMLPSGCFIGAAAALSVAGPVGLLLHVGGSRRAGRILLLFWLLQLLFLVSSVPLIRQGVIPGAQGADAIVFVSDVLCAVFLGYSIPVLMLLRNAWASGAIMAEQPPTTRNIPTAGGLSAPPCLVDISLPESSFLVRQAGGWTPFATIAPPPLIVAVPAYSSAVLFHVSPEGSLPVASFLLQSQDGPVCRIRRRTVLLKTTGYTVEDPQSGRVVFDLSKLSADGADWTVDDWTHEPVGSLSLRKSGPSDIDFDLITGGLPTVRYSWRATTWFSAEVAAEWARPAPSGFQPGLVLAVGVALALFLPATLSRGWRRWGY